MTDDNTMPDLPSSDSAFIAEAMLNFTETVSPILEQAKQMRERLLAEGWDEVIAVAISSQVMTFWLSQYLSAVGRTLATTPLPAVAPT